MKRITYDLFFLKKFLCKFMASVCMKIPNDSIKKKFEIIKKIQGTKGILYEEVFEKKRNLSSFQNRFWKFEIQIYRPCAIKVRFVGFFWKRTFLTKIFTADSSIWENQGENFCISYYLGTWCTSRSLRSLGTSGSGRSRFTGGSDLALRSRSAVVASHALDTLWTRWTWRSWFSLFTLYT